MGEDDPIEPSSLEYIEDSYLPKLDLNTTPSLDEAVEYDFLGIDDPELSDVYSGHIERHWSDEDDLYLRSLTLDQILSIPDEFIEDPIELQTVETEFSPIDDLQSENALSRSNRIKQFLSTNKLKFLTRKKMRDVRVTFVDFSKPYLAKISSGDNYKSFLNIGSSSSEFLTLNLFRMKFKLSFNLIISFSFNFRRFRKIIGWFTRWFSWFSL